MLTNNRPMPHISIDDYDDYGRLLPPRRRPVGNQSGGFRVPMAPYHPDDEPFEAAEGPMPIISMDDFDDNGHPRR